MEHVSSSEVGPPRERAQPHAAAPATAAFDRARALYLLAGALIIGLVFWRLQFSTPAICCGDFDGYYHIRWSQLLWQNLRAGHFPPRFTWLPLTTLNPRDYVDHHLLFHILQIPFTWLPDLRFGAKLSAAIFAALAVYSCYWLLLRERISYPLVWLLALLGSAAPFLYRMNMAKAMSVSIVLLIGGIYLLFRRKYVWLLPLTFLFTLTYDMFVLLAVAAGIWVVVLWWSERRFAWRPLLYVAIGITAGLVINPYFPHNVRLLYEHVLMKVTAGGFAVAVGNEWYPYDSWDLLRNSVVAFAAMLVGYVSFRADDRKRAAPALFFLIFATLLLVANARWRRFAEYWPPFAVLFGAFSLQLVLDGTRASIYSRLPADVLDELRPFLDSSDPADEQAAAQRRSEWQLAGALVAGLALCVVLGFTVYQERKEIRQSAPPDDYRAGLAWLRANVPPGALVFNTDWDDFPKLFYYDPTHAYVSGLDPTYLYDAHPDLSKLYEQITLGKERNPGPLIRDRFGARYVFTDNEDVHDDFYDAALDSGWFEEVYADDSCTILHIRDVQGPPPPPPATTDDNANPAAQPDDTDDGPDNTGGTDNTPGPNQTRAPQARGRGQIARR